MRAADVRKGLRVVIEANPDYDEDVSQQHVGECGVVADNSKHLPDVLLDNGVVVVCSNEELRPEPGQDVLAEVSALRECLSAEQEADMRLESAERALEEARRLRAQAREKREQAELGLRRAIMAGGA